MARISFKVDQLKVDLTASARIYGFGSLALNSCSQWGLTGAKWVVALTARSTCENGYTEIACIAIAKSENVHGPFLQYRAPLYQSVALLQGT